MTGPRRSRVRSVSAAPTCVLLLLLTACELGSTDVAGGETGPATTAPTGPTEATGPTAATGATGSTAGATLEGTWEGTWGIERLPDAGTFSMVITPSAGGFAGTIEIQDSTCVTSGTMTIGLKGDRITFGAVEAEKEVSFTGVVSADQMSGTWETTSCPPPPSGIWEAVRSG